MKKNFETRKLSNASQNNVLETIWNNELNRWSDFIDTIIKNQTLDTYRGYNIVHSIVRLDNSIHELFISITSNLQIRFGYNPKVQYIMYYYCNFYEMAGINKYLNGSDSYSVSILGFNYFDDIPNRLLNSSTLLEMLLIDTFCATKSGQPQLHANSIKELLKRFERDFGIVLTEYENDKNTINDLDLLIRQNEVFCDAFLCELSKEK